MSYINIGKLTEEVNTYCNTEFTGHQALPGEYCYDLTLGASGTTYIAPTDGWVYIRRYATSASKYITIQKHFINSSRWYEVSVAWSSAAQDCYVSAPMRKNEEFRVTYSSEGGGTSEFFIFVPTAGSSYNNS